MSQDEYIHFGIRKEMIRMYVNQKKMTVDKPKTYYFAVYGLGEIAAACRILTYSGLRV